MDDAKPGILTISVNACTESDVQFENTQIRHLEPNNVGRTKFNEPTNLCLPNLNRPEHETIGNVKDVTRNMISMLVFLEFLLLVKHLALLDLKHEFQIQLP